ncbi:MAG TPA: hypothetical protein VG986_15230 [Pseudolabrys sp.]|nr:hypothetical protein [Pseudolabrys sp.]
MADQSSMHVYLNWAKERIDEMDAALASLEARVGEVQADSKAKANQLIANLQQQRDVFQGTVKEQRDQGEAAWSRTKTQLESQWNVFEGQVRAYIDTVGKQFEQQQTTFQDVAAAQLKAWQDAADTVQGAATKFAAERRAQVDAALKQMKADAAEAEARFQKLQQAGNESWTALSAALDESRKAFDRANQAVMDAFKQGATPKS